MTLCPMNDVTPTGEMPASWSVVVSKCRTMCVPFPPTPREAAAAETYERVPRAEAADICPCDSRVMFPI